MDTRPAYMVQPLADGPGWRICYPGSDGGWHLAVMPRAGGPFGALAGIPTELEPDDCGFIYYKRVDAENACRWLLDNRVRIAA
jgi:hypothetical protein